MPDEIIPITLYNAAVKFDFNYNDLLNLGKSGQIALSRIGSVLMTDENSIRRYLEFKTAQFKQERYIEKQLQEKQEEIDNIIALYDDYLFSMRTLSKYTRLFKLLIHELANAIKDDVFKAIFIEVSLGQSIYNVARKRSYTYDKVCSIYSHTLDIIEKRCKIIPEYRKAIASLKLEIRQNEILNNNLKENINQIDRYNRIAGGIDQTKKIPTQVIYLLSLSIKDEMGLDTRTTNALLTANIYTVEDLLRYLCKHDCVLSSLEELPRLGSTSFYRLKDALIDKKIIDNQGYSNLYEYLA